jgi:magnesium transporter
MVISNAAQNKLRIKSINWQKLTWLDIEQPTRDEIEYLKQNYHFHDLELDDCLRRVHRPTIDEHETYLFMMFHFPVFHKRTRVILPSQLSVFLGRDYLITLHEGNLESLVEMFKNCELNQDARIELMARSSAHLLYHILDHLVDYCFTILNGMGDTIEKVQEQVFRREIRETVPRDTSALRRDTITFHRIIKSQTEVFELLEQSNWPMLKEEPEVHFGDLVGHSRKIRDELDDYKEVIEGLSAASNTLTSFRTNQVIRALTIISTIMLPLTLVASIFGMHLEHLPLSQSTTSFLIIMVIMIVIITLMLAFFRLRRWL